MCKRISAGELEARYKTKHELYDFFDEQGIYIAMETWYVDSAEQPTDIPKFIPNIGGIGIDFAYADGYKTRKEAEEQAFLKAFEILENQ